MGYRYRVPQEYNAPRFTPDAARELLARCGIPVGTEYCNLTQSQTAPLLEEADRRGYRPPRRSQNSLTLHFYSYVHRVAKRAK